MNWPQSRRQSIRRITPVLLTVICAVPTAAAPDYGREAFVVERSRTAWRFENDGTGTKRSETRVRIQSDAGIQTWGQLVLGYNAANERLDIVSVRVTKPDGTAVTASASAVQDLSSSVERIAPVYTDWREKHVTVPGLRPGDVLEYAATLTVVTPLATGQFWVEHDFAKSGIVLDEQLEIDVPADRKLTVKTKPGIDSTIAERSGRRVYQWRASRLSNDPEDDKKNGLAILKKMRTEMPAVRMTTFIDWNAVGQWYGGLERSARAPTVEIRKKAAELTAGRATDLEKVQVLYEYVAGHFRYVSLSFGVGRYQPHAAADVLRNEYGDCKDKHTLLASLIESIGLKASAALVNSHVDVDPDFPSPSQFDHVITRTTVAGEEVWLDATAEVAPFRLLLPTLRKKHALVVDDAQSGLRDTPPESPVKQSYAVQIDASLGESGTLSAHVRMAASGDVELLLRMAFRQTASSNWNALIASIASREGLGDKPTDWHVSDPASLREPFMIDFRVDKPNYVAWTKKQFDLELPLADSIALARDDDESTPDPVELGPTRHLEYRLALKLPAGHTAHPPLRVAVDRDYARYRAEYRMEGLTFIAERTLDVRGPELPAERRGDHAAFRRVVSHDRDQKLALERSSVSVANAAPDMSAKELYDSGTDALENGSYRQAIVLLERVTALEPRHKSVWTQLGRAYMALHQLDKAIAAFQQQVAINPYDLYSYNNLGLVYTEQHKYTDGERAFRKQLEIDPLNTHAHTNLGNLYLEWQKHDAAAAELEQAATLAPTDATLRIRIGQAYLHLNQHDRAMASFDRAAELRPDSSTWNEIAYQLALNRTDLELGRRYAESAVAAEALAARNISIDHVTPTDLYRVRQLAASWDTLGWVYLAQGDTSRAEQFVRAAWLLIQDGEVGDHLGQIYERERRRDDAIRMYAMALSAERAQDRSRERLVALAGDDGHADALVHKYAGDLVRDRTVTVDGSGATAGSADLFVTFSRGQVDDVKFIEGDKQLLSLTPALRAAKLPPMFPDGGSTTIVRRGTMSCAPDGRATSCRFVMMPLRDAQFAQQQ
jgi:tetratricopeptide (TPR) repeat protein